MDTSKMLSGKLNYPVAAFALLVVSFVFSSGLYSNPSDVIVEFPTGYEAGDSSITFDSMRNELSEDGEWIKVQQDEIDAESVTDGSAEFDDDINKDYVWRPNNVDENWSPYTNGYWTYTNCGWMWVSYYTWGWRPYHYGRWWWSPVWGWVWSPGYIWAPAWVVWMFYDNYCGWYPLSPRVRWRRHHHHWGYYCHHMRFRVRHWVFCHNYNFHTTPINHTVIVDPKMNPEILKHSKFASDIGYANGTVTNKGPDVREIEKSIGKKIIAEDVSKYNTTRKVNEFIEKNSEENTKYEKRVDDKQTYQEKRENNTYNEKPENNTYNEKRENNTNNQTREKKEEKSYEQKESTREKNSNEQKQQEYNYEKREEKKNDNVNENQEKSREQYNGNNRNENNNKPESPRQEKKNESPPQDNEKKNENTKQNDDNKSGEKDKGNNRR